MPSRTVTFTALAAVISSAATAAVLQTAVAGGASGSGTSSSDQMLAVQKDQLASSKRTESIQHKILDHMKSVDKKLSLTNARIKITNSEIAHGNAFLKSAKGSVAQLVTDNKLVVHTAPGAYPTNGATGLLPRMREDLFVLCDSEEIMNHGFPKNCK